jgi:hypothetical protein
MNGYFTGADAGFLSFANWATGRHRAGPLEAWALFSCFVLWELCARNGASFPPHVRVCLSHVRTAAVSTSNSREHSVFYAACLAADTIGARLTSSLDSWTWCPACLGLGVQARSYLTDLVSVILFWPSILRCSYAINGLRKILLLVSFITEYSDVLFFTFLLLCTVLDLHPFFGLYDNSASSSKSEQSIYSDDMQRVRDF